MEFWWSQVVQYNSKNQNNTHLKRILTEKELKQEFAEVFSQKGCNKSVVCDQIMKETSSLYYRENIFFFF